MDNLRSARDAEFRMLIQHLFTVQTKTWLEIIWERTSLWLLHKMSTVHEFVSPCSWRLQLLTRVFCLSNSSKHFAVNKHLTRGDLKSLLRLPPLQVEKKSIIIDYWNDVLVFYVPLYSLVSCNPWKKRKEKKRRGIDFGSFVYVDDKVIAVSLTICSC
jgi:hypothetical protein